MKMRYGQIEKNNKHNNNSDVVCVVCVCVCVEWPDGDIDALGQINID